ncbi:VOC family protein [Hyphomonas pacifica]|uniref:Uncharacterized protein n=1 Tax=Hyphomonas pacifica TaxID=1280941 RepID=A0A062TUH3_9PROT|nr:VOC family protein [Hyphomonas pacifica]KCZ45482.1 hypothetical protein HY2_06510 [Hyphomonas pacifica]RAN35654.1 hypothetical protein HY3_07480 [Hyphomonas pacifica]RAN36558.1 hypothetical protein HY11_02195 [Hyphomonas pacifica]
MISHITLGTNDLDRAIAFYEPIMQALGHVRVPFERSDPFTMWKNPAMDRPLIALTRPTNGAPHEPGNGQMVAFLAPTRSAVDAVHALAIAAAAQDEGAPGLRPLYHPNYYGAYFRDPDGNKICVVCHDAVD